MDRIRQFFKAMRKEQREHRSSFIVFTVLRLSVIAVMLRQLYNRNYESVFLCLLTLLLLIAPSIAQITLRVEIPTTLEIIIFLFIYAAEILGEIQKFYLVFPHWDTILHTLNGFLCAAIGFSLVSLLNQNPRLCFQLSPAFMVLVAFCFSMTVGVLWEFFEFAMDQLFGLDMQKDAVIQAISSVELDSTGGNTPTAIRDIADVIVVHSDGSQRALGLGGYLDVGIIDTMEDLFVNFIGAIVFAFLGYHYAKKQDRDAPIRQLLPTRKDAERDYLAIEKGEASCLGFGSTDETERKRLQ